MKVLLVLMALILLSGKTSAGTEDSVFVVISGDTVHIWNTAAYENCGCLFRMDVALSNDTIYVTEVDTSSNWAFCICYFDLCTSVTGLQNGTYYVEVFRYMPLGYPDTLFYIGSTSFTYGGSMLAFGSNAYQSECYYITEATEGEESPEEFILQQNYPNPFNPVTTIEYNIPDVGTSFMKFVVLKVYNSLGEEVTTLVNEKQPPGNHSVKFNADKLPSGVYLYRLVTESFIATRKMVLLR
jgi:hypothetical protein